MIEVIAAAASIREMAESIKEETAEVVVKEEPEMENPVKEDVERAIKEEPAAAGMPNDAVVSAEPRNADD